MCSGSAWQNHTKWAPSSCFAVVEGVPSTVAAAVAGAEAVPVNPLQQIKTTRASFRSFAKRNARSLRKAKQNAGYWDSVCYLLGTHFDENERKK